MIKFKFKLNKKTVEATVPENWGEVTLQHVLNLEENGGNNVSEILAALTGQNYEFIENSHPSTIFEPLTQVLTYIYDAPKWDKLKLLKQINLGGKLIKAPKKLEFCAFGQSRMVLDKMKDLDTEKRLPINILADILSIYLQPAYDGKFVSQRVEDIKPLVLQMKAYEAMPYAFFFFKKLYGKKIFGRIGLKVSLKTIKNLQFIQRREMINLTPLTTS